MRSKLHEKSLNCHQWTNKLRKIASNGRCNSILRKEMVIHKDINILTTYDGCENLQRSADQMHSWIARQDENLEL